MTHPADMQEAISRAQAAIDRDSAAYFQDLTNGWLIEHGMAAMLARINDIMERQLVLDTPGAAAAGPGAATTSSTGTTDDLCTAPLGREQ